jgi:predicted DNA-binding transcriptional regulator YafY
VQGLCTLRHALRTFRVDHMRDVEDVRSKRKIGNPAMFFAAFAEPRRINA